MYFIDLRRASKQVVGPASGRLAATKSKSKGPKATPAARPQVKDYALLHGVNRGGSSKQDHVPALQEEEQAYIDVDADDEGLRVFAHATTCRHKIWAAVFESTSTGEYMRHRYG